MSRSSASADPRRHCDEQRGHVLGPARVFMISRDRRSLPRPNHRPGPVLPAVPAPPASPARPAPPALVYEPVRVNFPGYRSYIEVMMTRIFEFCRCMALLAAGSRCRRAAAQSRPAPARAEAAAPPPVFSDENARDTRRAAARNPPAVSAFARPGSGVRPVTPEQFGLSRDLPQAGRVPGAAPGGDTQPVVFHRSGTVSADPKPIASRAFDFAEGVLAGLAGLTIFATVVGFLVWLSRSLLNYRYWLRASKVQTDAHTKLVDRLTSNEDLLAYVQSPAGQRYLTSRSGLDRSHAAHGRRAGRAHPVVGASWASSWRSPASGCSWPKARSWTKPHRCCR